MGLGIGFSVGLGSRFVAAATVALLRSRIPACVYFSVKGLVWV